MFESKGGNTRADTDGKKSDLYCRYCKKSGHLKEDCYKLVGYPQYFKFNNRQKKSSFTNQYANAVNSEELFTSGNTGNPLSSLVSSQTFTKEQCEKLVQLFQSIQGGNSGPSNPEAIASANLVGTIVACHLFTSFLSHHETRDNGHIFASFFSKLTNNIWIIDSGATKYMTFDVSLLHNIKHLSTPILVTLPNSYKVRVICVGSLLEPRS